MESFVNAPVSTKVKEAIHKDCASNLSVKHWNVCVDFVNT